MSDNISEQRRRALKWIGDENAAGRKPMFLSATMAARLKSDAMITWDHGWALTRAGLGELAGAGVPNPPVGGGR